MSEQSLKLGHIILFSLTLTYLNLSIIKRKRMEEERRKEEQMKEMTWKISIL